MKRNIYGYGVSLGASVVSLYLVNSAEKCKLSGAIILANLFNIKGNVDFFRKTTLGLYNLVMGYNFYLIISSKLPEIKRFMNDDEFNEL